MIQLGHSLLHLLDNESARRGLTRAAMIECVRRAIVENFRRRGRIVAITVDDSDGLATISGEETVMSGEGRASYREVQVIPAFSPELLTECVEDYVASRLDASPWSLAETRVLSAEDDHYLVEVAQQQYADAFASSTSGTPCHPGEVAVLPKQSVASKDVFKPGDCVWAILKENVRADIDGGYAQPWRNVRAPLLASRTGGEFLGRMTAKLLNESVQAVVHTDRGMLIFPTGTDLAPLMSDNGRYRNMLQRLTGLERLVVVRQGASTERHRKLIYALREVAGLNYPRDFKLGCEDESKPARIYVRPEHAKRLVGSGGHNLYFIKALCGFSFDFKISYNQAVAPRAAMSQPLAWRQAPGMEVAHAA